MDAASAHGDAMKLRDVAGITDIGRQRDSNQDAYVTLPDIGIIAVADGMGGLSHGNVASNTAVNTLKAAHEALSRIVAEVDDAPSAKHRVQLAQGLEFLAHLAARTIQQAVQGSSSGTTLVCGAFAGGHLVLCHIGDSRAYLIRGDSIRPLTEDHTVAAARLRSGLITQAEHDESPLQHILYQALGTSGEADPDLLDVPVAQGDLILMCSDGLTGLVPDRDILKIIQAHENLEECAQALVDTANAEGGRDNITVVLARAPDECDPAERVDARQQRLYASRILTHLSDNERRMFELYADDHRVEGGNAVDTQLGLQVVVEGTITRGDDELAAVGLLGLSGAAAQTHDVDTDVRTVLLTPETFALLEPRRPKLTAHLLRGVLDEIRHLTEHSDTPLP